MNRNLKLSAVLFATTVLSTSFQNCAQVGFSAISPAEKSVRNENPFAAPFDPNSKVAGIIDGDANIPSENLRLRNLASVYRNDQWVKDCSAEGVYEAERAEVLALAAANPGKIVPVIYAVSFGDINDQMAWWAHNRAVLSKGNVGVTYIPAGPERNSVVPVPGSGAHDIYYTANHDDAKNNFKFGRRCFFDTVEVLSMTSRHRSDSNKRYEFITETDNALKHHIHYMYYGWCNGHDTCSEGGNFGQGEYANRLFKVLPANDEEAAAYQPQIVKLFVADVREAHFGQDVDMMKLTTNTHARGKELLVNFRELLNTEAVHMNFGQIVRNLSSPFQANGLEFAGLEGVPQLLHNMLSLGDGAATMLPSQYTPIVLDLGAKGVYTSSVTWGTYFNLAGQEAGAHRTAWLSGPLMDYSDADSRARGFTLDARRTAEDGFLVIPDADGKVRSSRNLFGNNTNGNRYEDGFAALREFTGKDCDSDDVRDRYVGPWDEKFAQLKIWVDQNRNGVSDDGEVTTLQQNGVAAINACLIERNLTMENGAIANLQDRHGNGTQLRTAYLRTGAGEDLSSNHDEIVSRIKKGFTSAGAQAEFRLAIDIIFKTIDNDVLQK